MSPILSLSFSPLPSLPLTTKTLGIWRDRQQIILNVKLWQTLLVAYSMSILPSFLPIRTTILLGAANFLTKGDNFPGSLVPGMPMWINSNQWGIRGSPLGRPSGRSLLSWWKRDRFSWPTSSAICPVSLSAGAWAWFLKGQENVAPVKIRVICKGWQNRKWKGLGCFRIYSISHMNAGVPLLVREKSTPPFS